MDGLTPAQQKTLDFLREEALAGRPPPTLREIASQFGYKSHRAAACHLNALKQKGFIQSKKGKARSICIRLVEGVTGISILSSIPAGFSEHQEQRDDGCAIVDITSIGFKPTSHTFALKVRGDSMIGKCICDGDLAIFEQGIEPHNGDIVAALIDGQTTLKTFVDNGNKRFLKAENPKFPNLIPLEELMIQGVFKGLIRKA